MDCTERVDHELHRTFQLDENFVCDFSRRIFDWPKKKKDRLFFNSRQEELLLLQ